MRKMTIVWLLCFLFTIAPTMEAKAIIWVVVKAAAKKIIMAIDLQIQRLQNKTIGLQNAQKKLENVLSSLKFKEINSWMEKQKTLYQNYYDELWKVKNAIAYYRNIKGIITKQVGIVDEYKHAISLFKSDKHFTPDEIKTMEQVYEGILSKTLKNIDELTFVINSFSTQMTDAARLEIIRRASDAVDENYRDLREYNSSNVLTSLQRAKDLSEVNSLRILYGLE
ncbi:conjugal transfer protein TraI [Chitinophaga eiseniae]|uniref:Conjugal transfer protein TraI n=1 Tax=Chitinophaga eiseniae TaxID=634771 RepID=A0A847SKG4_9BACT|nr:conjugal transfer protein TraI [Chitinophaga eiseniae]NLR78028.1 conjugal transfer protein TraI [Chitinophaga eiseniae]